MLIGYKQLRLPLGLLHERFKIVDIIKYRPRGRHDRVNTPLIRKMIQDIIRMILSVFPADYYKQIDLFFRRCHPCASDHIVKVFIVDLRHKQRYCTSDTHNALSQANKKALYALVASYISDLLVTS